jgi:FkbM family methyltransferase
MQTYNPAINSVISSLGLRNAARHIYWLLCRPRNGVIKAKVHNRSPLFAARDVVELRTVELALRSERNWLTLLCRALRPDDLFLDVGANLGIFSVTAALCGAKVVACEPGRTALERLRRNVAINALSDKVKIVEAALSNRTGNCTFTEPSADSVIQTGHIGGGTEVHMLRGDDLGISPTVIKIDVEGHEIEVLDGLKDSLRGVRMCLVERHAGVAQADILQCLTTAGLVPEDAGDGRISALRTSLAASPTAIR